MLSIQPLSPGAHDRVAVVVDLIGDLDATLAGIFAGTLAERAADGRSDVIVLARYVTASTADGLAALNAAVTRARSQGSSIALDPGNRRMRAAFKRARIGCAPDDCTRLPYNARHVMIARHAESQPAS
jgi:anti-anti-sigma regulatory factor